jgi:hypothetical protein
VDDAAMTDREQIRRDAEAKIEQEHQREQRSRDAGRWLEWSDGRYPDDSPGDVIQAQSDGTITLDDGITTWNPLKALAWFKAELEQAKAEVVRLSRNLVATHEHLEQAERERDEWKEKSAWYEKQMTIYSDKLTRVERERDEAREEIGRLSKR